MKGSFHAIVSGRVQMVMYRDYVRQKARERDIVGMVENLDDDTVRVHAEGEKEKLIELIEEMKKGSTFAKVDKVNVDWSEPTDTFTDFTVRF